MSNKTSVVPYRLVRSRRKTVGLTIDAQAELIVRAPMRTPKREIERIIQKHERWIEEKKVLARKKNELSREQPPITAEDLRRMADEALRIIPKRVEHFAPIVGVDYGRITIRRQKTLWGSCSDKGNLNFNVMLTVSSLLGLPLLTLPPLLGGGGTGSPGRSAERESAEELQLFTADVDKEV